MVIRQREARGRGTKRSRKMRWHAALFAWAQTTWRTHFDSCSGPLGSPVSPQNTTPSRNVSSFVFDQQHAARRSCGYTSRIDYLYPPGALHAPCRSACYCAAVHAACRVLHAAVPQGAIHGARRAASRSAALPWGLPKAASASASASASPKNQSLIRRTTVPKKSRICERNDCHFARLQTVEFPVDNTAAARHSKSAVRKARAPAVRSAGRAALVLRSVCHWASAACAVRCVSRAPVGLVWSVWTEAAIFGRARAPAGAEREGGRGCTMKFSRKTGRLQCSATVCMCVRACACVRGACVRGCVSGMQFWG